MKQSEINPCTIADLAYWCEIDDPKYPVEWQYSSEGQPMCTAFEPCKLEYK
jgi:hypothetical protein